MLPVLRAARLNNVEALHALLDADPRPVEEQEASLPSQRPLHEACSTGGVGAVQLLLDRGAGIDIRDGSGLTPLLHACAAGRADVVALLLDRGADPHMPWGRGQTPLITASLVGPYPGSDHAAVIQMLIKDGRVPVDAQDAAGCTALWWACCLGHDERARVLLVEGGADHSLVDIQGRSAMATAKREGHRDCMRLLRWYECELERAFVLSRARAVADATESINKAPEKVEAKTDADAQQAREEAAPAYLRGRVGRGQALPALEVARFKPKWDREMEAEVQAVCQFLVRGLPDDLHVELMQGLTYRRWVPY